MVIRLMRVCGCACCVIALAIALPASAAATKSRSPSAKAKPHASGEDPEGAGYVGGSSDDARTAGDRDALLQSIEQQLAALPAQGPTKKPAAPAKDDYFALAMVQAAEPIAANIELIHGVHEVAEKVADFLLAGGEGEKRQWQVLVRAKNDTAPRRIIAESQAIERRLHAFSLKKIGEKKSPQDAFVVGTGELNQATKHADIRFQVMRGPKNIADFLVAYVRGAPKKTERQWHVFFRAPADDEAERYVQDLRKHYDTMDQQRAEMASIYHAKTTRRC